MIYSTRQVVRCVGFFLGKEVTLMDFFDWLQLFTNVGTFIVALLTYFDGKK